ncbi:hypothetical protein B0H11DRAFT_2088475, partial [Mycena galericulata]
MKKNATSCRFFKSFTLKYSIDVLFAPTSWRRILGGLEKRLSLSGPLLIFYFSTSSLVSILDTLSITRRVLIGMAVFERAERVLVIQGAVSSMSACKRPYSSKIAPSSSSAHRPISSETARVSCPAVTLFFFQYHYPYRVAIFGPPPRPSSGARSAGDHGRSVADGAPRLQASFFLRRGIDRTPCADAFSSCSTQFRLNGFPGLDELEV